jgi:hypothetical protein
MVASSHYLVRQTVTVLYVKTRMVIRINDLSLLWDIDNILHVFMDNRGFATVENDLYHHMQLIIHKYRAASYIFLGRNDPLAYRCENR